MMPFYLKIATKPVITLSKPFFTVGRGAGYDLSLQGTKLELLFTLQSRGGEYWLLPGDEKISVNGKRVSGIERLVALDRITWEGGTASFLDAPLKEETSDTVGQQFSESALLQDFVVELEQGHSSEAALEEMLRKLARVVGAEKAFIVSDLSGQNQWDVLARYGESEDSREVRRKFISSTILKQCLDERRPVAIESVIGHPLENQYSILSAQVFSVACVPLILGERVMGAFYFSTHTPGNTIQKAMLSQIASLGVQVSLVLMARDKIVPIANKTDNSKAGWIFAQGPGPMQEIDSRISKLAATNLNVLILGETGTGKERAARELHDRSARAKAPFVAVNCGAIPTSLIESTLFGHVKGAFTGAHRDQPGKFQLADQGTLFLDEIGDMPLDVQVKLLRAIQEGEVEPVGSGKPVKVNIRIVAATHQSLENAIAEKRFREDLFYRIHGAGIVLPPLRERSFDIELLAKHFAAAIAPATEFSSEAIGQLVSYSWPGNVRELEQVIQRSIALAPSSRLEARDIDFGARSMATPNMSVEDFSASLKDGKSKFTASFVNRVLERNDGNRARTAKELGISERSLYRLLASDKTDSPS